MRIICGIILAAAVYCGAFAALGDSLGNIGDVRLKGRFGERLDAMIARHVADRDVDYITAPFMEKTETGAGGRPSSVGSGCIRRCHIVSWSWRVELEKG